MPRRFCLLGFHDWRERIITWSVWPVENGTTTSECRRCGKRRR